MNLAYVGCGFVADYYAATMEHHPHLNLVGVFDKDPGRNQKFAREKSVRGYESLEQLLADDQVDIVVNLTNPRDHYEVSKAALLAGKHVYSEKPLSTEMSQAIELVDLAKSNGLQAFVRALQLAW